MDVSVIEWTVHTIIIIIIIIIIVIIIIIIIIIVFIIKIGNLTVFSFNLEWICTSELISKLHEPLQLFKNPQVQINSKLNEKNRMITL